MSATRSRSDLCPGVSRPWPASDGLLVRLRLVGGRVASPALRSLCEIAERYGDGRVHLTSRANLQLRALPGSGGELTSETLAALEGTGLIPTRSHELVRNIMVSPQTGLAGGRVDLRPVAADLDAALCADPLLAMLPGRFLFVLDDGRGDVARRTCDLGLVALDSDRAQLRVGAGWGSQVPMGVAAARLASLARAFVRSRGSGPTAPWHVVELADPLVPPSAPHPPMPGPTGPLPFGAVPGGHHVEAPESGFDRAAIAALTADVEELVVTPWRGVLVPEVNR